MKWQVFGHEKVKTVLESQLASQVFAHAYLFTGPSGVGKKMLAIEFAKNIRETQSLKFDPDVSIVDVTPDFGVEETRELMARLRYRPSSGKYAVTIVDNADRLNIQSSNSLLKTLEEPVESAIIILISSTRGLLPTILSRCQVFAFNTFSSKQLDAYIAQEGLAVSPEIKNYAFGSVGRLLELSSNHEFFNELKSYDASFEKISSQSVGVRMAEIAELSALPIESLERMLSLWVNRIIKRPSITDVTLVWVRTALEAKAQLQTPINKKFILERVLLTLPKI